jgi:hypothetical protein
MARSTATMKVVSPNRRTPDEFAALIKEKWQDQVKSIIEVGTLLETAKAELPHGEWLKMVKDKLPFKKSVAAVLMRIADSETIANFQPSGNLPAHWTILDEITHLSSEAFEAALASGAIHPKMTRKDAKTLRGETPKARKRKARDSESPDPIGDRLLDLRDQMQHAFEEIPSDQRPTFIAALRQIIDQIEE